MTKATKTKEAKAPVKATMKLITGADAINKAIASIQTRGKSLDKDTHIAAVSCLAHADKHGDVTLAQRLVDALPSMGRKNALRDWFLAFGKFSYDDKNKTFTFNKKAVTLLDEAIATPFWTFKPEPEYVPFDINAAIARLVKSAESAIAKGDVVPTDKLEAIKKLVA